MYGTRSNHEAVAIMKLEYGIGHKGLSEAIIDVTGTLNVKPGRHNTPTESVA
jgi:hypothetical protein